MAISEEDINAVRERADLVQIVSEHVSLKKKGKYFWGCCPFHKEKTPSFKVDPVLQLYHCFGCGEGGNIFTFVMKMERLDFADAVRAVADSIGYMLRYEGVRKKGEGGRKRLYELNEKAVGFYQYVLSKTDQGKRGLDYLKGRGFSDRTIADFSLGFSPATWDSLTKNLLKKGAKQEDLLAVGLSIKGERGIYDRFRGRVIFPITDLKGQTVAFGGRVLGDETPKYMNSPESVLFKKSNTLYGLFQAKNEIVREGRALVVEGYTDVIALHQAGVKTAVATLGTAFTEEHLALLSRFAEKVVLVFDSDAAGLKAAERGIAYVTDFRMPGLESVRDLLNKGGTEVMVAVLPAGLDPAEMIEKSGPESFLDAVGGAVDFMDFAIDRVVRRFDLSTTGGRTKAARAVLEIIATLDSAVAQEQYLKVLARKLETDLDSVLLELRRFAKGRAVNASGSPAARWDVQSFVEREFLKIALQKPELRERLQEVGSDYFVSPVNQRVFAVLSQIGEGKFELDLPADEELTSLVSGLTLEEIAADNLTDYFSDIFARLKEFYLQRQINSLRLKLEQLNPIKNSRGYDELFAELLRLETEKRSLKSRT
ncbi:MAG: DNA primase [Actinobacteria bacterium]|nr:DNA primase [Actinomycetota bacterium]